MIGGASTNLQVVIDAVDNTAGAFNSVGGRMNSIGGKMKGFGQSMTMYATAPILGGMALATKSFMDFEDAMVEVQKVTNPETARKMGEAINEMSKRIPMARTELAGLAADSARFGIKGVENIKNFTEVTAKMATATDLSSQEAGIALAKLATLTDTPVSKIENLGSTINALSNTTATSSSEIVDSMLRSSAQLAQLGLNQKEMVGLSAALNEVSASSERAGTRLRTLGRVMMDPGKAKDIAKALGMTSDEFARMRDETPLETIKLLVQTMAEGDTKAAYLRSALGSVATAAVGPLSENLEGLNSALNLSNDAYAKGTSLQKEFKVATDTLSAKLKLLWNRITILAGEIGETLKPIIVTIADKLKGLTKWFSGLSDTQKKIIVVVGLLVAALGPLLMIIGTIVSALPMLAAAFSPVGIAIGLAIAQIVALVAYFKWLYDRAKSDIEKLTNFLSEKYKVIKKIFNAVVEKILLPIKNSFKSVLGDIESAWERVWSWVVSKVEWAYNKIKGLADKIKEVMSPVTSIGEKVGGAVSGIGETILGAGKKVGGWLGFQHGGVVPGSGPVPAIVHGGERIIPKGEGFGNVNVYIQGGYYLDKDAGAKLAEEIGNILKRQIRYQTGF